MINLLTNYTAIGQIQYHTVCYFHCLFDRSSLKASEEEFVAVRKHDKLCDRPQ